MSHHHLHRPIASTIFAFLAFSCLSAMREARAQSIASPIASWDLKKLEKECLDAIGDEAKCSEIADRLEKGFGENKPPEAIRMLAAILRGKDMSPGVGWFAESQSRYGWPWLTERLKKTTEDDMSIDDFGDNPVFFKRLDRNADTVLNAADMDWSMTSPYARESGIANSVFRSVDKDANAQWTREELLDFFDRIRGENETVGIDAFRRSLPLARSRGAYQTGDEPSQEQLVRGFFASEIGSHYEGPRVGERAPDFTLETQDGTRQIRLSDCLGAKPVVLIFGNFSCGPFRRIYPEFDAIAQRYQDQATFLGIYVREAHPEDGWMMESNRRMGVRVQQPKGFNERREVAATCAKQLQYSIPLLVDTMEDTVGNTYSGMPARAYVIAPDGIVVYQSGRGPFGFLPGEMEQSLVMTLMELQSAK